MIKLSIVNVLFDLTIVFSLKEKKPCQILIINFCMSFVVTRRSLAYCFLTFKELNILTLILSYFILTPYHSSISSSSFLQPLFQPGCKSNSTFISSQILLPIFSNFYFANKRLIMNNLIALYL